MPRVSEIPFEQVPQDLQEIMRQYDDELGGSGFVQVLAQAPDVFRSFIDFYFPLELETRGAVNTKITELARLMVAQKNNCHL
ncbi:MAG: hypothetical protein VCB07_03750 [Gammaproteobacteria bacterium]|jgi:hypothetical protein